MSRFHHAGVSKIGVGSITCYRQIRRLRSCPAALNGGSETETNSETLASRICSSLQSSLRSENHKLSHSQDGGEEAGPTRNKRERTAIRHRRSVDTISLPNNQTSPTNLALQKLQHQNLKCTDESSSEKKAISSLDGTPVHWHATLEEVPSGVPTIIIAHEFYDALPVHQNLYEAGVRKWLMWEKIHSSADVSAYVDFPSIKHSAEEASENVTVHGPMTQSQFLDSLGINFRVDALLQNCDNEQAESLRTGY
ncbi:hypothetical protein HID58_001134 [Brassica napus]|uniref:Protein arginine methyltransferase NDUFAF7 n=1 Tax=Brassica napus TaxID=3708 RepID=A0ABQ8EJL7_BRANA|nr:hypothetical protein HID58_001134 [Brassica napus]